jgi:DNA-binding response OmpR family regulator
MADHVIHRVDDGAVLARQITIVDRYPEFVGLMEAVLADRSCAVTGLDVTQATADDLASTRPDLVVVGIGPLPDDPARKLYLDARRHRFLGTVPFLVTGSDPTVLPPGASANAVITMPFEMDELLNMVDALLRRQRTPRLDCTT